MKPEAATRYLELVIEYASDILEKNWGVNHAEFVFVQVCKIIEAFPHLKDVVLSRAFASLEDRSRNLHGESQRSEPEMPRELILYLAHRFRWAEFETMARAHLYQISQAEPDMVNYSWVNDILDSLKDDWGDLVFYPTLRDSTVRPYPYETDV